MCTNQTENIKQSQLKKNQRHMLPSFTYFSKSTYLVEDWKQLLVWLTWNVFTPDKKERHSNLIPTAAGKTQGEGWTKKN